MTARLVAQGVYEPAVHWWPDRKGMATVERPSRYGLRLVGAVRPHDVNGRYKFDTPFTSEKVGWFLNNDGEFMKNGEGLVGGVVYQLTTRKSIMRFVPGYRYLDEVEAAFLDFSNIFYDSTPSIHRHVEPKYLLTAQDCARAADGMAEQVGEDEREYRLNDELLQQED
jgi:hypothetical protein